MSACPETERFAALLRSLKSRSGLSYEALARKSGLAGSTLHRYCRGTSVPQDYGSVHRLATVCGATPDELRTLHRLWALADAARAAAAAGAGAGSAAGAGSVAGAGDGSAAGAEEGDDRAESEAGGRARATDSAPGRDAGPVTDSAPGRAVGPAADAARGRDAETATDAASGRAAGPVTDSARGRAVGPAADATRGRDAETATDAASGRETVRATDSARGRAVGPAADATRGRDAETATDAASGRETVPVTDSAPGRDTAPTTDTAPGRDPGRPGIAPSPRPAGWSRRRRLRTSVVTAAVVAAVSVSAWALTNGRSPSAGAGRGAGEDRPLFSAGCSSVIAMGQHDECVREVQRLLHAKGADIGVDGDFGPQTLRRVTAFQVLAGLQPNGVVGEPTKKALYTSRVRMGVWSPQKVRQRVREAFPEVPDKAVAIADCQSFLDPLHILPNTNGTRNWGLFQISDARLRELGGTPREALDPEWNIRAARKLWSRDRDFGDWPHCERAADAPRSPATAHSGT
ncbi:helix-turn-helix domain-containing protein [Streptomyces luteogriseus]|uniref:helix-turn-helix domain-containing protein n=1 Tax=Streptomyces luteogriseus TaxID=68233 RepID=UPI001FE319E0|nr:helix-turn-helix domain-containing protein [Streptomyces luteogriseus]